MNSLNHLRIYSEYSIGIGIIRINQLIAKAKKMGLSAIALTDVNNIFAAVHFYQAAIKAQIKPIIASEVSYKHPADQKIYKIVLYCQNQKGYHNLSLILSKLYQSQAEDEQLKEKRDKHHLSVSSAFIAEHNEGLIALNGSEFSDLFANNLNLKSETVQNERIAFWKNLFQDRFYLEAQSPITPTKKQWLNHLIQLAHSNHVPVVATHPTYFLNQEDFLAHEIRICIDQKKLLESQDHKKIASENKHLINQKEFETLFKGYDSNLFNNAEIIAKRCNFTFTLNQYLSPKFETKNKTEDQELTEKSQKGLMGLIQSLDLNHSEQQIYQKRLEAELTTIKKMQFSGYFLVVADYVNWAKDNAIPVAPGRGSGAGSLVAYALNITAVNPIEYHLIFERFLNPERISMPDFDIDFCAQRRGEVINYIKEKYHEQIPVQIITFGSMNAKAVVRDVARVLSYPYIVGDRIAKEIVGNFKLSDLIGNQQEVLKQRLEKAKFDAENSDENFDNIKTEDEIRKEVQEFFVKAAKFQELYHQDEEVKDVVDNAIKLEGLVRNVGTHAGGVIIAPEDIRKFTPVYADPDRPNQLVSQFEMKSAESIGLIKFDFLGVSALSVIAHALKVIEENYGKLIDLAKLKPNSKKVYALLRKGLTSGIFQLESAGMKKMLIDMKINSFDELIAALALFRPGPLGSKMDRDFIDLKRGKKQPSYLLKELEPILSDTRGVLIYQEQVMKIAQEICGYSLAKADELRKAMGKKDAAIMNQQKQEFIQGGVNNGYSKDIIEQLFEQIYKFASYGFNKSHSVAYAIVSYYTAYLKTFYPEVFFACEMSEHFNDSKSLQTRILELNHFKQITLKEPNINTSNYLFVSHKDGIIDYALGAIKGVGKKATDEMIHQRNKDGVFKDFADFCHRVDLSKVNKGTIESLIYSGAMDKLYPFERKVKIDHLILLMQAASQHKKGLNLGMASLFDSQQTDIAFEYKLIKANRHHEFALFERLNRQFKSLGYYPNQTPLDYYYQQFKHLSNLMRLENLIENRYIHKNEGEFIVFAQLEYFAQEVKDQKVIGLIRVSNAIDKNYEFRVNLNQFIENQELLQKNKHLVFKIKINHNQTVELKQILNLAEFRTLELDFFIDLSNQNQTEILEFAKQLKQWFGESKHSGDAVLLIKQCTDNFEYFADIGKEFRFYPTNEYLDELQSLSDFKIAYQAKNPNQTQNFIALNH